MLRVERMRRLKNWSVSELSRRSNVERAALSKMLNKKMKVSDLNLKRLAHAFRVKVDEAHTLLEEAPNDFRS